MGSMLFVVISYCVVLGLWWILLCCWLSAWRPSWAKGTFPILVVLCILVCLGMAHKILEGLQFAARLAITYPLLSDVGAMGDSF